MEHNFELKSQSRIHQKQKLTSILEAQSDQRPGTPMMAASAIDRSVLKTESLKEIPSRPMTPNFSETVIHHTPQASKKPIAKAFNFFNNKPEGDKTSRVPKRILDALSLAGLRKSPKEKKHKQKSFPAPRKLAVQIVDGKSGAIIRTDVPVYRLIDISSNAKQLLETTPRLARYKIHGKYKPASVRGVVEAITWLQPIPISSTLLMVNLFTYEASLRLWISNKRIELKPLLTAIYKQISSQPVDDDIMAFVVEHLGIEDPVFKHTAHVLCYERYTTRFTKPVSEKKAFEKKVAKAHPMQKFMVQIDKNQKAERQARKMWRKAGSSSDGEKVAANVEIMLSKIALEKETDHEQKVTLLGLFKADKTVPLGPIELKEVEQKDKTEEFV